MMIKGGVVISPHPNLPGDQFNIIKVIHIALKCLYHNKFHRVIITQQSRSKAGFFPGIKLQT